MRFFLGTHHPVWLARTDKDLFVSDRQLRDRRSFPRALGEWALDSGGFTELQKFGGWHTTTPAEYVARVRRYRDEIGGLVWVAPQDWMCEPFIIHGGQVGPVKFAGTGLSVREHLHRTVANLLELRALAPDLPIVPSIQGYERQDYETCLDLYARAGIDLAAEPVVAVGSVCRRQATHSAGEIITAITEAVPGIRLHGFGIKTAGLDAYGSLLASSDSMAWSLGAWKRRIRLPECTGHQNCANCMRYALQWRDTVVTKTTATPPVSIQERAA